MNNDTTSKIHAAERNWHNTIGEYLLRYAGIFLALLVIVIGLIYGYKSDSITPKAGSGHVIKYDSDRTAKTLLFVTVNSNESYNKEANLLKEAITSYHGIKVLNLQKNYELRLTKLSLSLCWASALLIPCSPGLKNNGLVN